MVGAANGPIYDELTGLLDLPRKTAMDLQPLLKGLAFALVGVGTEGSHGWMLDYLLALSRLRCKCSTLTASDKKELPEIDRLAGLVRNGLERLFHV